MDPKTSKVSFNSFEFGFRKKWVPNLPVLKKRWWRENKIVLEELALVSLAEDLLVACSFVVPHLNLTENKWPDKNPLSTLFCSIFDKLIRFRPAMRSWAILPVYKQKALYKLKFILWFNLAHFKESECNCILVYKDRCLATIRAAHLGFKLQKTISFFLQIHPVFYEIAISSSSVCALKVKVIAWIKIYKNRPCCQLMWSQGLRETHFIGFFMSGNIGPKILSMTWRLRCLKMAHNNFNPPSILLG